LIRARFGAFGKLERHVDRHRGLPSQPDHPDAGDLVLPEVDLHRDEGPKLLRDTFPPAQICRHWEEGRSDFGAVLREAAAQAREAVLSEALKLGTEPRDLASTLLALMAAPDGGGALQIGDGVIVVSEGGDEWSWVFWPQRGESCCKALMC